MLMSSTTVLIEALQCSMLGARCATAIPAQTAELSWLHACGPTSAPVGSRRDGSQRHTVLVSVINCLLWHLPSRGPRAVWNVLRMRACRDVLSGST